MSPGLQRFIGIGFLGIGFLSLVLCFRISEADTKKITYQIDKANSFISFQAIGRPSALRIHGKGGVPQGSFNQISNKILGSCSVLLSQFDTGMDLRNRHMKEKYLETSKYPQATFSLDELNVSVALSKPHEKIEGVPFQGRLLLHGIERPVSGFCSLQNNVKHMVVQAEFSLKISDFQIQIPSFMGVTVADEVKVQVELTAVPQVQP